MASFSLLAILCLLLMTTTDARKGHLPAELRRRQAASSSSSTCITAPPSTSSTPYTSGIREAGTVIIYSPYYSSCPGQTSGSSTTSTIRSSSSTTSSAIGPTSSAPGTFGCNSTAYFVQTTNNTPQFYNINLNTGSTFVVNSNLGNGRYINVNGMGLNPLDNFLYAVATISTDSYAVVRISASGVFTEILDFTASITPGTVGDIDVNGHFWFSGGGVNWYEVDLAPGSSTYGTLLANGTSTLTGYTVLDWSYIPGRGNYMYAVASSDATTPTLALLRWSLTDPHTWSTVQSYPTIAAPNSFIASWSASNGTIWGYAATSGNITQIDPGQTPYVVSRGLQNIINGDGARCYLSS